MSYRRIALIANKYIPAELINAISTIEEERSRLDLHREFDDYLKETGPEILATNADTDEIFEKYFKQEAPFGTGDKKLP